MFIIIQISVLNFVTCVLLLVTFDAARPTRKLTLLSFILGGFDDEAVVVDVDVGCCVNV